MTGSLTAPAASTATLAAGATSASTVFTALSAPSTAATSGAMTGKTVARMSMAGFSASNMASALATSAAMFEKNEEMPDEAAAGTAGFAATVIGCLQKMGKSSFRRIKLPQVKVNPLGDLTPAPLRNFVAEDHRLRVTFHHDELLAGRHDVVVGTDDDAILAVIHAKLVEIFRQVRRNFPPG